MRRYGRRYEIVPVVERLVEYDLLGSLSWKDSHTFLPVSYVFSTISANTFKPFFVTVFAARRQASATERSGVPLQERVIWEKRRCSMGLNLEQYGG